MSARLVSPAGQERFVGQKLRRLEDPRLLQGQGRYVGDLAAASGRRVMFIDGYMR